MNLHGIVSEAIGAINPSIEGTITPSIPSTVIEADGTQIPKYGPKVPVTMQVQALTTKDLMQLDSLNVSGSTHTIYINGRLDGIIRRDGRGGDLIKFANGETWLVTQVLERWPDWCKVSAVQQLD